MRIKSILAGVLVMGLVGCTTVAPTANEIPTVIANATTSADHQKIADYFAQKAAGYDAEAAWHDRMARSYSGRPKGDMGAMSAHCRTLRDQFVVAAKEARALAEDHRQVALKGAN